MSKSTKALGQLRDQSDDELKATLATTRDDLFRLQLGQHTNQVTSTAALTTKRREIAKILTVLRGRALGTETQAQKAAASAEAAPAKTTKKTTKKAK